MKRSFDTNGMRYELMSTLDYGDEIGEHFDLSIHFLEDEDMGLSMDDFAATASYDNVEYENVEAKKRTAAERKHLTKAAIIIDSSKEENKFTTKLVTSIVELIDVEKRVKTEEDYLKLISSLFNSAQFTTEIAKAYVGDLYGYSVDETWEHWTEEGCAEFDEGFKALQKWAIEDNKDKAVKLFRENVDFLTLRALQQGASYHEIANILYTLNVDKYICSSTSKAADWWKFNRTRWVEMANGITELRRLLVYKIKPLFKERNLNEAIKREKNKTGNSIDVDKIDFMVDKTGMISKQLSEPSHKGNILREAADLFFEDDFLDKLDEDTNLFAFNNKVWNCNTLEFEEGNPCHYISQCADYDMISREEEEDNITWWYDQFINKVFPPDYHVYDPYYVECCTDPDCTVIGPNVYKDGELEYVTKKKVYHSHNHLSFHVKDGLAVCNFHDDTYFDVGITDEDCTPVYEYRDFFFTLLSAGLGEGGKIKKYLIVKGATNNGKSVFNYILNQFFGQYYTDTPKALLLTEKKQGDGPTPGWHQLNKCKATGLIEPSVNSKFHDGNLKLLTNGGLDRAEGRDLFMKGSEAKKCHITPKCIAYSFCNSIPIVDGSDEAIKTRVVVCPLVTKFDGKCKISCEKERMRKKHYPRDENFKDLCQKRIPAFAHIMIDYYKKFASIKESVDSISTPHPVKEATDIYLKQNDILGQFLNEKAEILPDDLPDNEAILYKTPAAQLYNIFEAWYGTERKISRENFYVMMMKADFSKKDGQFLGLKVKE